MIKKLLINDLNNNSLDKSSNLNYSNSKNRFSISF